MFNCVVTGTLPPKSSWFVTVLGTGMIRQSVRGVRACHLKTTCIAVPPNTPTVVRAYTIAARPIISPSSQWFLALTKRLNLTSIREMSTTNADGEDVIMTKDGSELLCSKVRVWRQDDFNVCFASTFLL
jgi:hypothetical protein